MSALAKGENLTFEVFFLLLFLQDGALALHDARHVLLVLVARLIIADYHWCDYHWVSLLWLSWSSLCSKQSCHIFLKLLVAPFLYFDNQGGKNITLQNMTTLLTSSASWAIKYLQVSYDSACNAIYLIGQNMVKTPQLWVLSCIWQCFPFWFLVVFIWEISFIF